MKTPSRSFASITLSELVAGAMALALFGATLTTFAQDARTAPRATAVPVSPAAVTPPKVSRVLADPASKMYMPCRGDDDLSSAAPSDDEYKANPNATVMTEEAAKAKGFRASAHKVACPE
ncbi:MAG: hypothetical protein ABW136_09235 [Steroidobacteraceae bacterium]